MSTMLERAKQHQPKQKIAVTDEQIDVALAWMREDLTLGQVASVFGGNKSGTALYRVAVCLREAYRRGLIQNGGGE